MPQTRHGSHNNESHIRDNITNHEPDLSLGPELERRAAKILELLAKLEMPVQELVSLAWEGDYEQRDLLEHVNDLNHLIEATAALMKARDSELPQAMVALRRYFEERIVVEKAKSWELSYQCRDLQEDLWKLQLQLRSSVPVEDITHPPLKPRSAMERALADRIVELEDKLRNPKGRARSCSI